MLSCVHIPESLTVGGNRWYYSNHETTVDRASMACEDKGTRLMTLDEFLPIQRVILANMPITDRSIWLLDPVSTAPLAFNMEINEEKNYLSTAFIMCKLLSEYTSRALRIALTQVHFPSKPFLNTLRRHDNMIAICSVCEFKQWGRCVNKRKKEREKHT